MTQLPELRAAVSAAAVRRARPAPRRRLPFRAGVVVLGAVLASGTALAAGVWSPQLGDDHREHPTISASPVPADQLSEFGVLRRPATDADHGAEVRYALRFLDGHAFQGVRTDEVRLLSGADSGYVLVPAARADLGAPVDDAAKDDALCLFAIDPVDGGGLSCWTTADILAGKATLMMMAPPSMTAADRRAFAAAVRKAAKAARGHAFRAPPGPRPPMGEHATISGLVPDGVASVAVSEGGATRLVGVTDNFFSAGLDTGAPAQPTAPSVRWFDGSGREIIP